MLLLQKLRPALLAAIVFVLAFDAAYLWQRAEGANESEFGGHPDEAAHYVTGLMIRDYAAAHFPGSPLKFAEAYYEHYPKIGLKVWPPVFHSVQAAWTLLFGVSRQSLLLLMCLLAAAAAAAVFHALNEEYGGFIAGLGALVFVSLPLVREYYGMVMAETLSTVFVFGATLAFGNFLDRGRTRDAIGFGLLAALAIMTKGTGLALIPMAVLAILFTRQWKILARPALSGAALLTAILAGPWTWKFRTAGYGGWEQPHPSLAWTRDALIFFLQKFGMALGLLLVLLLGVGVLIKAGVIKEGAAPAAEETEDGPAAPRLPVSGRGRWASLGALMAAVILFQSIIPAGKEARHLIPALPAGVAFAMAGFAWCLRKALGRFGLSPESAPFSMHRMRVAAPLLAGGAMLFGGSIFPIESHRWSGFGHLAAEAIHEAKPTDAMLVSSDSNGEGMFIAEVAMRDPHRPSYTVKRASKELAASEWSGRGYRQKYDSDADLLGFLMNGKFRFLVEDDSIPEMKREPHHDTLKRVIEVDSGHFWQLGTSEIWRNGEPQTAPARLFRIEKSASAQPSSPKTK